MQSSCHCWGHKGWVWHFCSSLKFRSPVVLQHSDIIVASILRIASSRNVGGSSFSSLLVLALHLQTQFLSFCKVRLFFFSCIITENCHRVNVVLNWRQMKVPISWMKTVFTLSDFYRWYLLTSASLLMPRGVEYVLLMDLKSFLL